MKVTLKQIAEIAGVHRSTVDKVIHDRVGVSDEVREKVKRIIDELGYKPNIIGKALACQNKPIVIAVVLLSVNAIEEIKVGIEEAYKEYESFGVKIEYYQTKYLDESEQLTIINLLKSRKIDGMIITPLNGLNIKNAINEMVDKGIPVVTVNVDLPDSKRLCFVGQDMMMAGRVSGELMGEILNGQGNVAVITSSVNMASLYERQAAFEEVILDRYPNIKVVDVVETYENKITAFQKTLELLKEKSNVNGMYITCGNVSEIMKAVKLMNKEKDIKIISFDLYPEIVELVKQDIINFTIGQDLFNQGYKSVKVMFERLFFNKLPETSHIKTSVDIRLKYNINS